MRQRTFLPMLLDVTGSVPSCGTNGPLSPREAREAQAARSPVRAAYRVEVRQRCEDIGRWTTVTVVNDSVTDVRVTDVSAAVARARMRNAMARRPRRASRSCRLAVAVGDRGTAVGREVPADAGTTVHGAVGDVDRSTGVRLGDR